MNLCVKRSRDVLLVNCEYIKGYSFKMVAPRGESACMTGVAAHTREYYVHFDRKTCLLPFDLVS